MEKITSADPSKNNMNLFYRFFCWCSGARLYLLKQCPTEYNKYFGIGIIIFLTGILAAISGAYAMYTIFKSIEIAIAIGIFWGILIFFLDWYLVSSLKKEGKWYREIIAAFPRLALALFLSIIIAKPLELRLFEKEIDSTLVQMNKQKTLQYKSLLQDEFNEIPVLEEENTKLKNELRQKETLRTKLFEMIIAEAEGRSPTATAGKGPVYKEKKEQYDKISAEYEKLSELYSLHINENNERIQKLKQKQDKEIRQGDEINKKADGFLAMLQAFGMLSDKNKLIYYVNWFIILLFATIESAPVLVKLISNRGPYDELIELEEYKKSIQTKKEIAQIKAEVGNKLRAEDEINQLKIQAKLNSHKDFMDKLEKAQEEMNKLKIEKWKNNEKEKLAKGDPKGEEEIEKGKEEEKGNNSGFKVYKSK